MKELKQGCTLNNGKYRIEQILGQGGFGITYLAYHEMLEYKVAIKEFFLKEYCNRNIETNYVTLGTEGNREMLQRFQQKFIKEAKTIFKLRHPNIINIHDIFEENGTAYYVMEYIEGCSLGDIVKKQGKISEKQSVEYFTKIANTLAYIHERKINHLDIKPANIMVRKTDNEPIVIDFGLAKQYDVETGCQTSTTPVGISHGFAPIEQYKSGGVSEFSPQTDIYSLGATLYKIVSGKTPPEPSEILMEGLPSLTSIVSPSTWHIIESSMKLNKKERPKDVATLINLMKGSNSVVTNNSVYATSEPNNIDSMVMEDIEATVISTNTQNPNNIPFVDLGLSVKWATRNVGANSDYEIGNLYPFSMKGIDVPDDICGNTSHDICKKIFGGNWRLPTNEEQTELRTKCQWQYDQSHNCYIVKGPNGMS